VSRQVAQGLPGPAEHRRLVAVDGAPEGSAEVHVFGSAAVEAAYVADVLRRAHLIDRVPWSEMAVVVRTAKKWQRPDGSVVKFDDNACVLINKAGEPIGSRVSGVVAGELRAKQWSKILSLAPMHV